MSGQYCVDANVFITAWHETYPPRILSTLWDRIAEHKDQITIIQPVYEEIEPIPQHERKKSKAELRERYPVRMWLQENGFIPSQIDEPTMNLSLQLELRYQISDESKGANQIDMTLIAFAKLNSKTVVTLEAVQIPRPGKRSNYKIPAICGDESVLCIGFVGLLDELGIAV